MDQPARLTPHLLARKGQALPAAGRARALALVPDDQPEVLSLASGQPLGPFAARREQMFGLAGQGGGQAGGPGRAALTVRLDRARHLRLKIFAARHQRTSQDVIVQALDGLLDTCGDQCPCLKGYPPGAAG
jgi:hypothetical protein